ncbi:cytolytic toxin-alpha-like [Ictalurus furcatus]|uniref:cytolytic toxin-alpha-like n=1 Tax=Ictalurus furcatus TaxID=66913 RepID=UPI00235076D1|nr:cytolytic toxin-alpha-like [Ictalurus furcatus]
MEPKIIMMSALGRALYPGMLYDCRMDSFIPGVTLWDKHALRDDIDVHDQTKTFVKLAASDSVSEKANLLDVSASLKASFLGGLVEVGGSAKFLQDSKSSARQCRVTMQYSQTTTFEQLTMKELGNVIYPQVFEQKTATHVVTAVLYGASAVMVFDYTTAENESKQVIEGNLYAVIKKIPTISIEGQASLKMTQDEKKLAENMNVTFYGDYELEENPTTFTEALRACKRLPSLLKERNSKGVPVTVWLYPLTLLDNRAAKLVREISSSLVSKTETQLEELSEVERRCNDLLKNPVTFNFPDLKGRLLQFQDLHSSYKIAFQKALCSVLPGIRSGALENKALGDILNNHYSSPFTDTHMNKWLDDISTELNILRSYTSGLKDLTVVTSSGSVNSILFDPDVDVVVCLSFTSLKNEDLYLVALQDFVKSEGLTNLEQKKAFSPQATQPWFTSLDISARMRQNLSLFTSFSMANKNEKRIKFIIASIPDPTNPGTSIQFYLNGLLKSPKFQPVSKPPLPIVETSDEKVLLKLSKSPTGETVKFRVEYRMTPPTDSAADVDAWKVINTSDAQTSFTFTQLKPEEQYWVRYRAVSDAGVSEASDSVPFSFHGKRDVTVEKWDLSMPYLINNLRTTIMTSMGMSRWSLSTIKTETTNVVSSPKIPYTDAIPGGLKTGMAVYFQGVALATGKTFEINLIAGTRERGDITFHMYYTFSDSLAYNTRRNGNWENVERVPGCPVSKGSAFDIFFVIKSEGYEVYVNGKKYYLFKHRMPVEKVNTLHIYGDVNMNIISTVPNWSASTFGKELISGISRTKLSNIQSDVPYPLCNPKKVYSSKIAGAFRPGLALFFQGVAPSDYDYFAINLQTGPNFGYDTALHFKPKATSVALNTCRNGEWDDEVSIQGSPFASGGAFDIIMIVRTDGYEVIVNGMSFCMFNHRIAVEKVNTLSITYDVFMNNFGIFEVGNVNMKARIPAFL